MRVIIRNEQLEPFRQQTLRKFQVQMAAHLRRHFPARAAAMDDAGLGQLIDYGIERAKSHGIVRERDVCKYLSLMMVMGRDFDADPALPWVRPLLERKGQRDATMCVQHVYAEAIDRLERQARESSHE